MNTKPLVLAAALGLLGAAGWGGTRLLAGASAAPPEVPSAGLAPGTGVLDRNIALIEERARADPYSAGNRAWLAALLLQRARETGNPEDVLRAEAAARESIGLRAAHNRQAEAVLAASLVEQHRFAEALEVARELAAAEPENPSYRAMVAEIQMELGRYDDAGATFGSLEAARHNLDVAPRLARWAEIGGRTAEARSLLYSARTRALARPDLPREQAAWFHLRVGDLELRSGRLDRAGEAFRAGLEAHPGDYRLLASMARLMAARERWEDAITYGEMAMAATPDAGTFALLGDLHAAAGDAARAGGYADAVQVSLSGEPGALHRAEALFLLDHGRRVPEVLAMAERDLRTRRDVHGYDLLAWALHKQGRHAEASAAMASALAQGTRDAMLFYHAGIIEKANGNRGRARDFLERALEVSPNFHPVHARVARETRSCLGAGLRLPWQSACD